jgi:hypothetical protein
MIDCNRTSVTLHSPHKVKQIARLQRQEVPSTQKESLVPNHRWQFRMRHIWLLALTALVPFGVAPTFAGGYDDLQPQLPAAFLPAGMLGIQLGGSWKQSKHNPTLHNMTCESVQDADDFDEVCFFKTSRSSRVGGAEIHDGFIVRKDDHVVLVGTGISIKSADDPIAESVVQSFQTQIHLNFQHTGDNVLFVKLPSKPMTPQELLGFSRTAPVLLVQLESRTHELAVLYGFLAPVNAFGSLTSD